MSELGLSFKTDRQKEAAWRMEFEALGEQSVLKNIKGATYSEAKRQVAFRWLSEKAQLRDRREARNADLAWLALFVAIAAVSIGTIGLLMALRRTTLAASRRPGHVDVTTISQLQHL
jgi:hypothetical protein